MNSNIPLYSSLKEDLINDIKNKKYHSHEIIPSENVLSEKYGISRPTVRQAIGELTNMGYLYKKKGKGTFVSDFADIENFNHIDGFLFSILDCNDSSDRNILSCNIISSNDVINDKKISEYFDLEYIPNVDNKFILTEYTVKQGNKTIYCQSLLPARYFPTAKEKLLKNATSIDIVGTNYQLDPIHCKVTVYLSNANEKIKKTLEIPKDNLLMVVESELFSRSNIIIERNFAYYAGLNCKILFSKGRKR